MEDPVARGIRLIEALETIAQQEGTILRRFFPSRAARLLALVESAEPLVHELAALQEGDRVAALRPRVARVLEHLRRNAELMGEQQARMRSALSRVNEARQRLSQVAPVYGLGTESGSKFRLQAAC